MWKKILRSFCVWWGDRWVGVDVLINSALPSIKDNSSIFHGISVHFIIRQQYILGSTFTSFRSLLNTLFQFCFQMCPDIDSGTFHYPQISYFTSKCHSQLKECLWHIENKWLFSWWNVFLHILKALVLLNGFCLGWISIAFLELAVGYVF